MDDEDVDYDRVQGTIDERHREPFEAAKSASDGPPSKFAGLDPTRRRQAEERQRDLEEVVRTGHRLYVETVRGTDSHTAAWTSFRRWRDRLELRYAEEVFAEDAWQPPNFWRLVAPLFDEDETEREEVLRALDDEAAATGAGPRSISVTPGFLWEWARSEQPLSNPFDAKYVDALDACGWDYVFHLTRPQHLQMIALFGLLEGESARWHNPGSVERDSRSQSNPEKELAASLSVFSSFWPPFWVTDKLGGPRHTVIVAVDAKVVCRQRGTSFFPVATRDRSVAADAMWGNANTTEKGYRAFLDCWDPDMPLSRGFGPRPIGPEILSARIHPRHIKALIFSEEADRTRYFPGFLKVAQDNYDAIDVRSAVGQIMSTRVRRKRFGFPP